MKALTDSTPPAASENSPTQPAGWLRFQGYTKLLVLGGGEAKDDQTPPTGL